MTLDALDVQLMSNAIVFFGVLVAIGTIVYNIRTAKKTQTAIFLFESRTDTEYRESLHVLKKAHRSHKSFRSYVIPAEGETITEDEMLERRKFQYILNFYERVAVSIRSGIYDEKMIKRTSYSTVLETWNIADPLIKAIRECINSDTTYQEFEWLVNRWRDNPLKNNSKKRWYHIF